MSGPEPVAWRFYATGSSFLKDEWTLWSADASFRTLCEKLGQRVEFAYPQSELDRLAAENAELKAALQDFEADDACEQRCQRLESENAELRAAMARARDRARVFDDGTDGADGESAQSCVAILNGALAARPNPENTDGR